MGVHSGYNSFLLKQKENSGSVTATFRNKGPFTLPSLILLFYKTNGPMELLFHAP